MDLVRFGQLYDLVNPSLEFPVFCVGHHEEKPFSLIDSGRFGFMPVASKWQAEALGLPPSSVAPFEPMNLVLLVYFKNCDRPRQNIKQNSD